jgi:hypothetical protein
MCANTCSDQGSKQSPCLSPCDRTEDPRTEKSPAGCSRSHRQHKPPRSQSSRNTASNRTKTRRATADTRGCDGRCSPQCAGSRVGRETNGTTLRHKQPRCIERWQVVLRSLETAEQRGQWRLECQIASRLEPLLHPTRASVVWLQAVQMPQRLRQQQARGALKQADHDPSPLQPSISPQIFDTNAWSWRHFEAQDLKLNCRPGGRTRWYQPLLAQARPAASCNVAACDGSESEKSADALITHCFPES